MTYSPKIAAAIHHVMTQVGYVQKTSENKFHGYTYAGEAALLAKLRPAMLDAGLLLIPSGKILSKPDEHGNTNVEVEYTLAHKDGDVWPDKLIAYGCGNDRAKSGAIGDKGVYKALTGANKYFLFKLFQIETGNDPEQASEADHDQPQPPPAKAAIKPEPQKAALRADIPAKAAAKPSLAVSNTKAADPVAALRDAARNKAREGSRAFNKWWAALDDEQCNELGAIAEELAEIGHASDETELMRA